MKKLFTLFAAVAAFTACSNEDIVGDKSIETKMSTMTFRATMDGDEGDAESRASIASNGTSIVWNEGDEISVISAGKNNKCTLDNGAGTTQGSFVGNCETGTDIYAIYPYSKNNNLTAYDAEKGSDYIIDWNGANQTAVLGSFPLNTPMVAKTENVAEGATTIPLAFQNVCALVKFTIDYACKKVVLTSSDKLTSEKIIVDYDANKKPRIYQTSGNTSNTVTLTGKDGANLEAGTYYIAVMPGTLASGFGLTFTNIYGEKTWTKSTSKSVTFKRGTVLNLGEIAIKSEMVKMAGSGTAADPYLIHDFDQLQHMRDFVNTSTGGGDCYKQVADIDGGGAEFTPIGTINGSEPHRFNGTYDGGGFTLKNIKVGTDYTNKMNNRKEMTDCYVTAPFAYVLDATIKNLTVENIDITGKSGSTTGHNYIKSPLIGIAFGSGNSGSSTTVENVTVTGVQSTPSSLKKGGYVIFGGIIALSRNHLNITNCTNHTSFSNNVKANNLEWGGIVGFASAVQKDVTGNAATEAHININKCRNYGKITETGITYEKIEHVYIGGILGYGCDAGASFISENDIITIIRNCVNFGEIQCNTTGKCYAGGIVGYMDSDGYHNENPYIQNSINNVSISISTESTNSDFKAYAGSIVGYCYDKNTQISYCANGCKINDGDTPIYVGNGEGTIENCRYTVWAADYDEIVKWMNQNKPEGYCTWKRADNGLFDLDL